MRVVVFLFASLFGQGGFDFDDLRVLPLLARLRSPGDCWSRASRWNRLEELAKVEGDLDRSGAEDSPGICEEIELIRQLVYRSQEFSYRVQRFVGRLLNKIISHGGDRRSPESNCQPSLAKTGISRYAGNRYRAMAHMSGERWEECMTQVREEGRLIKESDLRRHAAARNHRAT